MSKTVQTKTKSRQKLLHLVKQTVLKMEPDADIYLYGSRARGDAALDSDWDFLILVDGLVDHQRTDHIRHQLYEIEWEYDHIISSIIRNRSTWFSPKFKVTPFHQNVSGEGIRL